ncbi:MPEG1 protein, partial [Amia calva]|nr:MPEG1 protein [Amia calva]
MSICVSFSLLMTLLIWAPKCNCRPLAMRTDSGIRECKKTMANTPALEVLPGGGWDNIRNLDMGRVMNLTYSLCQTTEDGAYLIPDEVFVVPQKVSNVETNSEIIESWLDQRSSVASSINTDVSFSGVLNGKFSTENERMKTHQVREGSFTTRVQVRNLIYSVKTIPGFSFDPRFEMRVGEIASALENNQTHQAAFLSETLVLEYGTHVLTSVDAGASLVQEDYVRASFLSDGNVVRSSISASAGINFFNKVNIGFDWNKSNTDSLTKGYQGNTTYSLTQGHGGVPFYPGITLQKWQENTANNLVAIDRSGLPLHFFLNRDTLPDLPEPAVEKLSKCVSQAIERYYMINTHPGCVKPDSKNFNFQANVDDASCDGPVTNLSFGGVYQQCTELSQDARILCQALAQKNPQTGSFSCQKPYQATHLRSEVKEEGYSQLECHVECHSCWLFFSCCKKVCGDAYHVRRVKIDAYLCTTNGTAPEFSGYLFGGLYGPSLQNPLTKSKGCPPAYIALSLLGDGLKICLSDDYEMGTRFSVPFGGLFSCESGNPLAGGLSKCPSGFSQHLAGVSDGCQMLYCVRSGIFTGGELLPIRLPPFTRSPLISLSATNTVAVMTEGEMSWIKDSKTKMWKIAKPEELQKMAEVFEASSHGAMSGGAKFGVALGVTLAVALVVGLIAHMIRRKWRRGSGYDEI